MVLFASKHAVLELSAKRKQEWDLFLEIKQCLDSVLKKWEEEMLTLATISNVSPGCSQKRPGRGQLALLFLFLTQLA